MLSKTIIHLFCLLLLVLFAASSYAQTGPATSPAKIAVINSYAFGDEKAGITRYVVALQSLKKEFSTVETELKNMSSRLDQLGREIQTAREQVQRGVAVDERSIQAKVDEAEKLQRELKFKQEDTRAQFERRQQTQMGPIMRDIGIGLQEFAKQKGFTLIFDVSKDTAGLLIAVGDEKADVTKDFIAYYNARPANTAPPRP